MVNSYLFTPKPQTMLSQPPLTQARDDTEIIALWLSGKSKGTTAVYRHTIKQFLDFANLPLTEVMLEDLVRWMNSLLLRGYSQNTVSLKISTVKSLFGYAWRMGYLQVDMAKALKAPGTVSALSERILQQYEVKKLLEATKPGRNRVVLTLIYTTGLRASEALSINWQSLKPRKNGGQVRVVGKGGKVRSVLIPPPLWEQLNSLPRHEHQEAVFVTKFGNRLDRHQLHRIVKAAAQKAGINPDVSAHWLRHAHACHSLENGCDLDVLMRSLGHSSLTVTSQYLHARPEEGSSQFISLRERE